MPHKRIEVQDRTLRDCLLLFLSDAERQEKSAYVCEATRVVVTTLIGYNHPSLGIEINDQDRRIVRLKLSLFILSNTIRNGAKAALALDALNLKLRLPGLANTIYCMLQSTPTPSNVSTPLRRSAA